MSEREQIVKLKNLLNQADIALRSNDEFRRRQTAETIRKVMTQLNKEFVA